MKITVKQIDFQTKEYFQTLGLRYEVLRRPLSIHFNTNDLKNEGSDIHIAAFLNHRIIGCLILTEIADNPFVYKMRQVAVDSTCQQKGIGKKMVRFCETFATSRNFNKIELNARKSAVPFYLSLDYQIVGDEFLEVNIPHYKMIKSL
jgi:predicted GNAT family N-acyltransferase